MALSYADVHLPLTTPEHRAWLDRVHPQRFWKNLLPWDFDKPQNLLLSTPPIPDQPEFEFGVLSWPTGACRPAWFHAVVNTEKLDEIREAVDDPSTPKTLLLSDGRDDKLVEASMYMLPPRPLNQLGLDSSDGWVLTLTDQRFYWYWRRGQITATPGSWGDLFSSLGSFLGVSITNDAIDSRYGSPTNRWKSNFGSTPAMLDAAAAMVGQRVVVRLDGTVRTVNWETAQAASDSYAGDDDGTARVISGALLSRADIRRYVPAAVRVIAADSTQTGVTPPAVRVESKTLVSLAMEEYGESTGISGSLAQVYADFVYDGTNAAAFSLLATAAAEDWYGWRLEDRDTVYAGIEPWVMTGWEDEVRWTYQRREGTPFASTQIVRGQFGDMPSGDQPFFPPYPEPVNPGSGSGSGGGCTVYPDGDSLNLEVRLGPELECYGGEKPVMTGKLQVVLDTCNGKLTIWPYSITVTTECCVDCPFGSGSGSGGGGSGSGSGSGGGSGWCETYTVGGSEQIHLVASDDNQATWVGDTYFLHVGGGGQWRLDNRFNTSATAGRLCIWKIDDDDWDGTGCATLSIPANWLAGSCPTTIEVCCGSSPPTPAPNCTEVPPDSLPTTLNFEMAGSGSAAYANGVTGTLTSAIPGTDPWESGSINPANPDPAAYPNTLDLECVGGQYTLSPSTFSGTCTGEPTAYTPVSGTTSPFSLVFEIPACWWKDDADPTDLITVTVTE